MLGRSFLLSAAWPNPLVYRSSAITSNATNVNKPSGVAVGDLVVIATGFSADPTLTTSSGSAWTKNSSVTQRLFYKILDATDVTNNWVFSVAGTYCLAVAYSGGGLAIGSVTVRSSAAAGPSVTSLTIPGFALSAAGNPRGVIAGIASSDSGNSPTAPTFMTARIANGNPAAAFADAQRTYTGQAAPWTGLTNNGSSSYSGWLLEVL